VSNPDNSPTADPSSVTGAYTPGPASADDLNVPGEQPGSRIGPYTLTELIGEGGMGVVFRADQSAPVRRTVAVKLIKAGMDTRQVLARFDAERQALALMDHPNIAKVLDAGATGGGRPYFVMEYVRGEPITQFADGHRLTPRQRLELFIPVCQAIQHAHQKGIIHRDIKPSNVLVALYDGKPIPKVIDFGIAKATGGSITGGDTFTNIGNVVGTPEYMAPEQAVPGQEDVDTRSDVYSLGVLLYELLTGSPPLDRKRLKQAAMLEVLRVVREEDPPRPSTKLSSSDALPSIAACRQSEPARLTRLVRGELDWIVMKALEKDRDRRYGTANGLAADVQRYLDNEPVSAGPPSQLYRVRKFVRRNRAGVVAASLVLLAMVGGIVGTSIGLVRADRARVAEERQRGRAETIARFMSDTLKGAGPAVAKGRDNTLLKELMDGAAERINKGELTVDPEAESELRRTLGNVYVALGEMEAAESHLRRAAALARTAFGLDDSRVDQADLDLGRCLLTRGRYDELKSIAGRVMAARETRGEAESETTAYALTLFGQADYNLTGGATEVAEQAFRRALDIRRQVHPAGATLIGDGLYQLAFILNARSANDQAEPLAREALDLYRKGIGPLHPTTLNKACALADILEATAKYAEAEQLMRASLRDAEFIYGPNHRGVADVLWRLGRALDGQGRPKAAVPIHERCLAIRRAVYPGPHKDVASALAALGQSKLNSGDAAGAAPLQREALAMRKVLFGERTAVVASSLVDLGEVLGALGQTAEAVKAYEESIVLWRSIAPAEADLLRALTSLAVTVERDGQLDRAIALYQEVLAGRLKRHGPVHADTAAALSNLGAAFFRKGQKAEAEQLFRRSIDAGRNAAGGLRPGTISRFGNLAFLLDDRGAFAEAEPMHREHLELQVQLTGRDHPAVGGILARLGDNLVNQGRLADAEPIVREAVAIRDKFEPDNWTTFNARSMLGGILLAKKDYAAAEPLLLSGYEGMQQRATKIPPAVRATRLPLAAERLVKLYEETNKPDDAAKWRETLEALKKPG